MISDEYQRVVAMACSAIGNAMRQKADVSDHAFGIRLATFLHTLAVLAKHEDKIPSKVTVDQVNEFLAKLTQSLRDGE